MARTFTREDIVKTLHYHFDGDFLDFILFDIELNADRRIAAEAYSRLRAHDAKFTLNLSRKAMVRHQVEADRLFKRWNRLSTVPIKKCKKRIAEYEQNRETEHAGQGSPGQEGSGAD